MVDETPDEPPVRWQPKRDADPPAWPNPPLFKKIANGVSGRCPACGRARLFCGYLRVVPKCPNCGAPLGEIPAESIPTYLTLIIVGVIVFGALIALDSTIRPSVWTEAAILLPLTLVSTAILLRLMKGVTVALMLGLGVIETPPTWGQHTEPRRR